MSDRKSTAPFSGGPWKRWLEELKTQLVGPLRCRQLACGLGIAAVLVLLVLDLEFRTIPHYKIGDIAVSAIKAPVEMTVPDDAATARKRTAAAEAAPPVFDIDSGITAALETEVRNLCAQGRALLQIDGAQPRRRFSTAEPLLSRVHAQLESRMGKELPKELIRVLLGHGFSQELENELVQILQSAVSPGVIAALDFVTRFQSQGLILRDISTKEEKLIGDVYAVRDLRQARSALRQKGGDLYQLSEPQRKPVLAYLEGLISPNISYNGIESSRAKMEAARNVDPVVLQVKKGKNIVREGDEITATQLVQLESLRQARDRGRKIEHLAGALVLVCFFLLVLWRFLVYFQTRHRKTQNHFVLIGLVLAVALLVFRGFVGLGMLVAESLYVESLGQPDLYYYAAPLGFGCILVVLLVDSNLALIFTIILASLAGLFVRDYGIMIYTLLGGFAAIFALNQSKERAAIVKCGLVLALVNALVVVALNLVGAPWTWDAMLVQSLCGVLSGILAAMLASWLLPLLENAFGITTDIRLLELSNLNIPILRRLAVEAPGTYHHSIVVGSLAEAAAEAIGANSLLVRVGAYYHDIGKIKKAGYYVENQAFSANKHEHLTPSMSSLIIASHVRDGLELADQIKLPQKIKDLIPQHHGTKVMTYFYQKAKDAAEGKNEVVDENSFRYGGPKPQSREAAILMLADTVEAASRTLVDPTPSQILGMVKHIAYSNFTDGQFDECDITMKDLDLIAHAFMLVLMGM
ncbi:MAG: HDIG domain-containing protein, partial [Acidobacteria bacterium]|nr:HDIG domain-containing protein [Acidobacteriota bacterium]